MATSLPSHRKLNLPRFDGDLRTRPGKHESPETNHDPTHDDILPYSHPLSPHATCSEDDPSQSINETNLQSHAPKSLAGRTIASHPLSPHDTSLDDENQVLSTTTSSSTSTSTRNLYTPSTTTPTDSNFPATTSGPSNSHRSNTNININNNNNNSSTPTKTILVINGPNLNLLGHREPHIYGHTSLQDITDNLANIASSQGIQLYHFQSNHEGQILDRIHACLLNRPIHPLSSSEWLPVASPSATTTTATTTTTTTTASPATNKLRPDAIIINPGALTHTSIALRDALTGIATPFIEVHISNVHSRESFRHKSYLSDKATAVVAGLGVFGYEAALRYWISEWRKPTDLDDGAGGTDATDANANARGLAGVKPS